MARKKRFPLSTVIAAILGIAITVSATIVSFRSAVREVYVEFKLDVDERVTWLEHELLVNTETLFGLKGLYSSSDNVTRAEFKTFATGILKRHHAIQALEWIPRVPHSKRGRFETGVRDEGYEEFQIIERQKQGEMVRAKNRTEYFPVCFVEPFAGNEIAFGFDLASNSARLTALNASRDTGELTATEAITLVQEKSVRKGFLSFLPVYQGNPQTVAERRENLNGFVLGVFRISDVFNTAIQRTSGKALGIDMKIYDATAPGNETLLHYHTSRTGQAALDPFSVHKTIENIGGRKWEITAFPTSFYIEQHRSKFRPPILKDISNA